MKNPLEAASVRGGIRLAALVMLGLTAWLWFRLYTAQNVSSALYVLDVGQGDSQLVVLTSENGGSAIKILIDGGKNKMVLNALNDALGGENNGYLDLVILTHADLDHLGGLIEVARRYDIGAFISNGRAGTSEASVTLQETLAARGVPTIVLRQGDVIRYGDDRLAVLAPAPERAEDTETNEAGLVMMLTARAGAGAIRALFTADIGFAAENMLLEGGYALAADILKVGHHGSKYSSGENFIAAVHPAISVIGVGKNSYGHPAERVLETLKLSGARVYRTDESGTVTIPLYAEGALAKTRPPRALSLAAVASILTGGYKRANGTTISLRQAREEAGASSLVPYRTCSFHSGGAPLLAPVIINEIAWMGSPSGATHEWVELRNTSSESVDISGWQLLNENERLRVTFPQRLLFNGSYMVLARAGANDALALNARVVFTGSLRNGNEGLRLYDNECNLIDEAPVSQRWTAGDNASKRTMERRSDRSWGTSAAAGGTPNKENAMR